MLVTFTRSTAIFLILVLSFFAATANAQSVPDRARGASASTESQGDSFAFPAFSDSFTARTIAANPVTWMEQCAARLQSAPRVFALSLRQEIQPWENDLASDRDSPSHSTPCVTQQFLAPRASLRNSTASQLSAPANSPSKDAASSPSPDSPLPPSPSAPLPASPLPANISSLPIVTSIADPASAELASLGKPGAAIAHARAIVLEILASDNACTAWFQTKDLIPADTFRSLTFSLDHRGQQTIFESPLPNSLMLFRQPYVARATQDSGPYTEITVNANGAFFRQQANIEKFSGDGGPGFLAGAHLLTVGYYAGDTLEAQVVTLLHEFGHILDLLPPDADDLDGSSARNTDQVLRHCRPEVEAYSKHARQLARR